MSAPLTGRLHARRTGGSWLLWPEGMPAPDPAWFDPRELAVQGRVTGEGGGRGTTINFRADGDECVLRHYRRGGLVRHLVHDRYVALSLPWTRPWRELVVTARLHALGLPVPRPVGARVVVDWHPPLVYRADLVTARLPATRTLARALSESGTGIDWHAIGGVIRRFHEAGVDHADLNAHNILLDDAAGIWLIDFDRARLRPPRPHWQQRNLARLRRSLDKVCGEALKCAFSERNWERLQAGYRGSPPVST